MSDIECVFLPTYCLPCWIVAMPFDAVNADGTPGPGLWLRYY
jgi:hypothetical protein